MEIQIEAIKPMRVLYLRHVGAYEECHHAWKKLFVWAGKNGFVDEHTISIGASYDDPEAVPAEKLRYDACIVIDKEFEGEGEFKVMTLGGGKYAKHIHVGSLGKIKDCFQKMIRDEIPQRNLKMREGPCLEIYLDDPEDVPEEKCQTQLCVPVE